METTLTLDIAGMHCEGCISNVEAALAKLPGVRTHRVQIGKAQVRFDESVTSKAAVLAAVRSAGPYQLSSFSTSRAQ
jgi:copper chaperone CopZ